VQQPFLVTDAERVRSKPRLVEQIKERLIDGR
jgi:hypothetical protein